ncbi:hypothetical protein SDC9_194122 [bioreactor metagenome]|uniref:Uncharacterized protein n=1 Tax=bioreactor metagenome TaxID=1076179 RepID=A0A645IGP7_9ZZZZ
MLFYFQPVKEHTNDMFFDRLTEVEKGTQTRRRRSSAYKNTLDAAVE